MALKRRETFLLGLSGAAVLVAATLLMGDGLLTRYKGAAEEIEELEAQLRANEAWLMPGTVAHLREVKEVIDGYLPPLEDAAGKVQSQLQLELEASAGERELRVEEQRLLEPAEGQGYRELSVFLRVRGSYENVIEWLVPLHQPENFRLVKTMSIELDRGRGGRGGRGGRAPAPAATEPEAVCNLTYAQWFQP